MVRRNYQQKSWQQRDERLQQHRGKVFSLIEGQCTQNLKVDKADDSSNRSSNRSRRSGSSSRSSSSRKETATKLEKHMKKQFANYSKDLAALKEESSISSNESAGSGFSFCIIGATLKQSIKTGVLDDLDLRTEILLDTQSTDNVFRNKKYLTNIKKIRNFDAPPWKRRGASS
jgi:hypothetical protein